MEEGFFALYYTGVAGTGFGLFILSRGIITGVDVGGGTYDGDYRVDQAAGTLDGELKFNVPPGLPLVTGHPAQANSFTLSIPLKLPVNLGGEKPLTVQTPTGPVNVVVKKLRDLPA
tara:strand:+ start:464 stop:811 length:348 start_codon:yes stop_codon:yes gene_type:complete